MARKLRGLGHIPVVDGILSGVVGALVAEAPLRNAPDVTALLVPTSTLLPDPDSAIQGIFPSPPLKPNLRSPASSRQGIPRSVRLVYFQDFHIRIPPLKHVSLVSFGTGLSCDFFLVLRLLENLHPGIGLDKAEQELEKDVASLKKMLQGTVPFPPSCPSCLVVKKLKPPCISATVSPITLITLRQHLLLWSPSITYLSVIWLSS